MQSGNHMPMRSTLFVLFGGAGDLATRQIVPALFNLYLDGQLPQNFCLLGVGHHASDAAALSEHFRQGVVRYSRRGPLMRNSGGNFPP